MRRLILPALLAVASPASAHVINSEVPEWTLTPDVVVPLLLVLVLYLVGMVRLAARSSLAKPRRRRGAALFLTGWIILAGALVSPLHEGGERSFTLHMIEHELIMLPAALLLVSARPGPVLLWGLPRGLRQALAPAIRWRLWHALGTPVTATLVQALVLIVWHMPALFDLALRHEGWHVVQHLCFIGSALLFWWAMLSSHGGLHRLVSALCLFVTSMIGGGLGALMALSGSPWYPSYAALPTMPFGLTPEQDQQLAGLIMWVPGGLFHLIVAIALLRAALASGYPQKFSTTA